MCAFRYLRRLSVLLEESEDSSDDADGDSLSLVKSLLRRVSSKRKSKRDIIAATKHPSLETKRRDRNELLRHRSDPLSMSLDLTPGSPASAARSTSRPLVMMPSLSGASSGTLEAANAEATDDEEDSIRDIDADSDHEARTNVGSCFLNAASFGSPGSSVYESPTSSPSFYATPMATPMDLSPWASPQSSFRSPITPTSAASFKFTITPSVSPDHSKESRAAAETVLLSVPLPAAAAATMRRSQSLKVKAPAACCPLPLSCLSLNESAMPVNTG